MDTFEIIIITVCGFILGNLFYWLCNDFIDDYNFFMKGYNRALQHQEPESKYSEYRIDFYNSYLKGYKFGTFINKHFKK